MPRVSAAVLNYNGRRLLEVILPSLAEQEYRDFETIVVDNGSTDDSIAYLRERWPQVRVVRTGPVNIGVAAALNSAVAAATGEFLALLNNDIELEPRWLGELVAGLDRHPRAGSASGKLLNYWRRDEIDGAGDIFRADGAAYRRGHGEADRGQYEREEDVFAPSAGAGLYRASVLSEVGPFDESFHAYYEDVDWGLRAQLLGHRCCYVPGAVAYHMGGATTKGDLDPVYFLLLRRNSLAVLIKDAPMPFLIEGSRAILARQLHSLAHSAREGLLRAHLRAYTQALRHAPVWWRARRRIQRGRRIGARELGQQVREWAS